MKRKAKAVRQFHVSLIASDGNFRYEFSASNILADCKVDCYRQFIVLLMDSMSDGADGSDVAGGIECKGVCMMENRAQYSSDIGQRKLMQDVLDCGFVLHGKGEQRRIDRGRGRKYWKQQYMVVLRRVAREHTERIWAEDLLSDVLDFLRRFARLAPFEVLDDGGWEHELDSFIHRLWKYFNGGRSNSRGTRAGERLASFRASQSQNPDVEGEVERFSCFCRGLNVLSPFEVMGELAYMYPVYRRAMDGGNEEERERLHFYLSAIFERLELGSVAV